MKTKEELLNEIEPYAKKMDDLFLVFYENLKKSKPYMRDELPPSSGIYVFYNEIDQPIYVGRTDDIRNRIQHHTRMGSKNGSATFAFNLAKREFGETKKRRKELDEDEKFIKLFLKHKKTLHEYKIRYLELSNDILQTMLEPYLAYKLGTYPINNIFENH